VLQLVGQGVRTAQGISCFSKNLIPLFPFAQRAIFTTVTSSPCPCEIMEPGTFLRFSDSILAGAHNLLAASRARSSHSTAFGVYFAVCHPPRCNRIGAAVLL